MPKDEFDLADPLELNGVALLTDEDTTDAMCECFIEEFMRMGYSPMQVLALFRNPHYLGMNMVLEQRSEQSVRDRIAETYARWGRPVTWPVDGSSRREEALTPTLAATSAQGQSPFTSAAAEELRASATDPMGGAIPELDL
jgi:hypothetical protein